MKKGALMGNHYHKRCATLFFLLSGSALVYSKDHRKKKSLRQEVRLAAGEGALFERYETHAWRFTRDSIFVLVKSVPFDEKRQDIHPEKIV